MDAVSIRGNWVGQVIDGKFPLLRWLGDSSGNSNFLTELAGSGSQQAAIKLIPASSQSEDRLALWSSSSSLSHPHLLRILHFGRADVEGAKFIYVVTDLADEVLSQVIPDRPLSVEETRELLNPVLDTLQYLHGKGYVHGHLKPANILVVENQVKLSSDSLLPIGNFAHEHHDPDIHIAPEAGANPPAPSADIWSLGITLVEALSQRPPIWDAASDTDPSPPKSLTEPFATIARECLHRDPTHRCTLDQVRDMLAGKPKEAVSTPPHLPHHQHRLADKPLPGRIPLIPLIIGLVLLVAIIAALQMRSHKTQTAPAQADTAQQSPPAEPDSKTPGAPAEQSTPAAAQPGSEPGPPSASNGDVVSRSLPDVPPSASNTIHGTVGVVVRVSVNANGTVTGSELSSHGPSAYFARLALESARNWKFRPPEEGGHAVASSWLLHYAFRRDGVNVRPEEIKK